ncbi:MAG: hypothetical protein IKL08_01820 [Clostridia bacterium]|nr:hypothetical protein [Clostridia bacterium]
MKVVDKKIMINRGSSGILSVSAKNEVSTDGNVETTKHTFKPDDVVCLNVMERGKCDNVVIQKEVKVEKECTSVDIEITKTDTRFGEVIHSPVTYWYEIEVNPDKEDADTILGYDEKGPKIFMLYPEGEKIK